MLCAELMESLAPVDKMRQTRIQFSAYWKLPRCQDYDPGMGTVRILRVYEAPEPGEYRVLVDRLWPRGISKDKVDLWLKEIAPSTDVRRAFDHVPERFETFERDYRAELEVNPAVAQLREVLAQHEQVVLFYGAKDHHQNQGVVLLDYIMRGDKSAEHPQSR